MLNLNKATPDKQGHFVGRDREASDTSHSTSLSSLLSRAVAVKEAAMNGSTTVAVIIFTAWLVLCAFAVLLSFLP